MYDIAQIGIIYDQNELLNEFIKSESLFDPFLVPKTTFFKISGNFGLIYSGFAFRFQRARARQYTQNDRKEHLCRKIKK